MCQEVIAVNHSFHFISYWITALIFIFIDSPVLNFERRFQDKDKNYKKFANGVLQNQLFLSLPMALFFDFFSLDITLFKNYDVLFCHEEFLKDQISIEQIKNIKKIKILVLNLSKQNNYDFFNDTIFLPTKLENINITIENSIAKRNFSNRLSG